jgi:hypothetical protein
MVPLCLHGARSAGLEFAIGAFVDVPMRPRMAHVAIPNNQSRVGLFEHE